MSSRRGDPGPHLAAAAAARARTPEPQDPSTLTTETFWRAVYHDHSGALLAFLSGRVGRRDEAEDLLQETFVRVLRARDGLRDASRVRSYLFSTAHRLLLNRGRRRRAVLFSEIGDRFGERWEDRLAVTAESPEDGARYSQLERRLVRALEGLSRSHRRAYQLAVMEGLSYAEVADREGWSMSQVKVNVFRARRRLLDELGDELGTAERS